jgi:hypothetical protein
MTGTGKYEFIDFDESLVNQVLHVMPVKQAARELWAPALDEANKSVT